MEGSARQLNGLPVPPRVLLSQDELLVLFTIRLGICQWPWLADYGGTAEVERVRVSAV